MTGGPSHLDTWDPKPTRPLENRGPFGVIPTRLPGVRICEHLPKQAALLDHFTLIRSVDCRHSNHEPNMVLQTGHLDAAPRVNRLGGLYPAIGSVVAKHRGANRPGLPPYVGFFRSRSHIAFAGYLGRQYDPFPGNLAARLPIYDLVGVDSGTVSEPTAFLRPREVSAARVEERRSLMSQFDQLRHQLDHTGVAAGAGSVRPAGVGDDRRRPGTGGL